MAAEILKSAPITNLDATPIVQQTVGEGNPGHLKAQSDYASPTTGSGQFSQYRLCRFPVEAKVKKVQFYAAGIDNTSAPTVTYDINVAFSDSATDGTPQTLQGTIPSNKRDNTSILFVGTTGYSTAYTSSGTGNKLFGVALTSGSGTGVASTQNIDVTFKNTTAAQGYFPADREVPLWNKLGFINASGVNTTGGTTQCPGGFFDIFVVFAAAVAVPAVGTIGIEVDYVL